MEEPDLIGTAAAIGLLPDRARRRIVVALFVAAAVVILLDSMISAGTQLGIDLDLLLEPRRWPRRRPSSSSPSSSPPGATPPPRSPP